VLLFIFTSLAFATKVTVTVIDSDTGERLRNAEVQCTQNNQTIKSRTNSNGTTVLECDQGKQTIIVFHNWYGKKRLPHTISGDELSFRIKLEPPAELIVVGEKQGEEVTRHVITAEELKMVPGTFGDPVRAIQSLPGVARPNIAEGSIVVRGAEGINTGFYVDGMPVPYMFHTLVGRSIIIPAFIDDIEFFPGGMPSKYGEVTQAVVNVRTDTEKVKGTLASLRVDFLDGGVSLEQKISDRWVLRLAGRYSWVGGLISSASRINTRRLGGESYEATYLAPEYWDSFADIRYRPSEEDEISLLFLASRDTLVFKEGRWDADGDGEPDPLAWEDADIPYNPENWIDNQFWRVRLHWEHEDAKHIHSTWISGGTEQQQNLLGAWWLSRQGPYRGRVGGPSVVVRRDDRWKQDQWGKGSAIVAGAQLTNRWFTAEDFQDTFDVTDYSDIEEVTTQDTQTIISTWIEPQWQTERFYIAPGIRGAFYSWDEQQSLQPEPRLTLRYTLPEEWILKAAVGRYTQAPPLERYAQGIGNPDLEIMKAWQASFGTEGELPGGFQIDSSIFGGWMQDLVVRDLEVDVYNSGDVVYTELQPYYLGVQGLAYGLETLIRLQPEQRKWWGWISMTISKALRMDEDGNIFPSDYDQPISFTAVAAYDLGANWEVSSRFQYTSGQPFTPLYGVYIPNEQYFTAMRGEINSDRYPYYLRLDARVQKIWERPKTNWMLYLDVYNLTSRRNPFIATYNYDYSELFALATIPIIPTLGLEVKY
jgi:hypothetical protein